MTPAIMEDIWEYSTTKGATRLLLLAIARHANHDGTGAYPSLATLKRLTRLSHSQVCLLLRQLVEEGHLAVTHGGGPGGTNAYRIVRTWEKQDSAKIGHPKIAHPKSAYAIAHPKIGHNQEPKEREEISVSNSDIRKSDMHTSDRPSPSQPLDPKVDAFLRSINHEPGSPAYAKLTGQTPPAPAESDDGICTPEGVTTGHIPAREKHPRAPALYFQGKLCPRAHDRNGLEPAASLGD